MNSLPSKTTTGPEDAVFGRCPGILEAGLYWTIVLILDGNSDEHVAHVCRKIGLFGEKNRICSCSRSNQMPQKNQITEIAPHARIYL